LLDVKNYINILQDIFIIKRIVNPQDKTIIDFDNDLPTTSSHTCFDFWKRGESCPNCISMRALNENASFSKVENIDDRLYMVIAAPIQINNDKYVVELLRDITDDTSSSLYVDKTSQDLQDEIYKLNQLAIKDPLTNTFNRRYLNEQLPCNLKKFNDCKFSLTLIMVDLDKFKDINDSFGHLCGDYILKEVSFILKSYVKNYNGWICRYGGDEFIMYLENISKEQSYVIADNLREEINNYKFIYNCAPIHTTCSFGVCFLNEKNINFNDIINNADMKLLEAKKTRNTVI
jgi:diguanylate cyclase (GGDEF)-like protein